MPSDDVILGVDVAERARPRPAAWAAQVLLSTAPRARSAARCAAVTPVKPVMSILVLQAQHAVIGIYLAQICGNRRLERHALFNIPISLIHHRP
jgi:hypothetical protein